MRRLAWLVAGAVFAAAAVALALLVWRQHADERAAQDRHMVELSAALVPRVGELLTRPLAETWDAVRRWELASGFRITVIAGDGQVLVDTSTVPDLVGEMENHGGRPEVVAARREGSGLSRRRSATTNRLTTYVAARVGGAERPSGFVRVAWEEPPWPFPWGEALVALATALAAGLATGAGVRRRQRAVARHLSEWTELSADEPVETLAEEADRRFRTLREELARELGATRSALAEVAEGVVLLDAQRVVRFANPAALAFLGGDLAVGRPLLEAVRAPELLAAVDGALFHREATHTEVSTGGLELAVRVSPLPHALLVAAVVIRDLSGERRLERARRSLVADLAHELRTPLTVLSGLAEEMGGSEAGSELVETLERQVRRLRTFAEELEELAAIESGQLTLHTEPTDALAIVRTVLEDLRGPAERGGIALRVEGDPTPVTTDPVRLAQVVSNLVDNGIRYNRPGGRVTVRLAREGEDVCIVVADDGIGIPPDDIPLVFQRFYRVRRGAQPEGGSGLGLAIVKHLVRALGGTVRLTSRVGAGTEVTLLLPPAPRRPLVGAL